MGSDWHLADAWTKFFLADESSERTVGRILVALSQRYHRRDLRRDCFRTKRQIPLLLWILCPMYL